MTGARHRSTSLVVFLGVLHAFAVVFLMHRRQADLGHGVEAAYIDPVSHWLRDSLLYAPAGVVLLLLTTLAAYRLTTRWAKGDDGLVPALVWAGLGAIAYALVSVPAAMAHGTLFGVGHHAAPSLLQASYEGIVTLRYSFAILLACAMVLGLPWAPRWRGAKRSRVAVPTPATERGEPC